MAFAVCAGVQRWFVTRRTTSSFPSGGQFCPRMGHETSSSRLEIGNPNPNREALPLSTMSVGITSDSGLYPLWLDAFPSKVGEKGCVAGVWVVCATAVGAEGRGEILGFDIFT